MDIYEMIEAVEHAESEIYRLLSATEELRGFQTIHTRTDTVMGKLECLKWLLIDKASRHKKQG